MKNILYCILFFCPFWSAAQSLSMEQLWESLDESFGQQRHSVEIQIRRAELEELRQSRIPVFYADANVQRNIIIPTTPVPAVVFDPTAAEGAVIPLKFSTKWSSKAGLQAEWNIFDPKRRFQEQEKVLQIRKAEIQKESDAQDWKREATLAYAAVVLATKQYAQAQQDSAVYAEIVKVSQARHEAGRESSFDYFEAQQELERKKIQLYEAWSVLLDADLELRKYIDLSGTTSLTTDIMQIQELLQGGDMANYTVKSLEIDQQIADFQQQQIKRQLLPSLTLNAYLGGQYYGNEFRLDRSEDWFGNSFVNLALRIPLSTYFTSRPVLRQAQLHTLWYSKRIEEEQWNDSITDRQAVIKTQAARQKIERLQQIERLARQNMEAQHMAYMEGRLLLPAYNQSVLTYRKAVQDVWQAQYDLIALLME